MNRHKLILAPWSSTFHDGAFGLAISLLLMQVSVVFWSAAVRRAHKYEQDRRLQTYLNDLSASFDGWRRHKNFAGAGLRTFKVAG